VSVRVRHGIPPSVNSIGFDPQRRTAEVRRWDHDAAAGRFVNVATSRLELTHD
jgi:hypothetical protein